MGEASAQSQKERGLLAETVLGTVFAVEKQKSKDMNTQKAAIALAKTIEHLAEKNLILEDSLVKRGTEHAKVTRGIMVWAKITAPIYWWCEMETYVVGHQRLSSESTMHVDCRGLSGDDLVAAKAAITMGKELTKVDAFSYQALRNIARQRWNHRLPEWHQFVDWIKTLPFSQELILQEFI